jgi:hypothetical protein
MTRTITRTLISLALILSAALSAGSERAWAQEGAEYTITFTRLWTDKSHPFEYPKQGLLTGPHLSGLIGCTHSGEYALFKVGTPPTPGLENLSENGKHSPLDAEIESTIAAGKAGALFETGPIRDATKTETTKVRVTEKYPMVSAVAMIAPSPDWFAGAADIMLEEDGKWVDEKTVEMFAYDSGGDDGTTYEASDKDNNPKKPTAALEDAHFTVNGKKPPVAILTFKKH